MPQTAALLLVPNSVAGVVVGRLQTWPAQNQSASHVASNKANQGRRQKQRIHSMEQMPPQLVHAVSNARCRWAALPEERDEKPGRGRLECRG